MYKDELHIDVFQNNMYCNVSYYRVAREPAISGNLEKSGNFMALKKCQGKVREFRKIRKSQGILTHNWEKSGNFTCVE